MSLGAFLGPLFLLAVALAYILWISNRKSELKVKKAEAELREAIARKAAEEDRTTLGRMADADAVSVTDTVDAARERMRTRNPKTR